MSTAVLCQYVIYERPADYPGGYVVRRWEITRHGPHATAWAHTAATLAGARCWVPDGLVNVGRYPEDDPSIAEVWT